MEAERLRQSLAAEFLILQSFPKYRILSTSRTREGHEQDSFLFDNLDDDPTQPDYIPDLLPNDTRDGRSDPDSDSEIPPERRPLILPSSHLQNNQTLRKIELSLRIKQASQYLTAVREAVAEKSFQYSQIMRAAPNKTIRTRSRSKIAKLNNRIALCCRIYGRSRAAMVRLGADDRILGKFRILLKEDVKASTAIINPNIAGSSSLRLSWIWETRSAGAGSTPETMRECELPIIQVLALALMIPQFSVSIGCGHALRSIDGLKNLLWLDMKWSGLQDISYIMQICGKSGAHSRTCFQVQRHIPLVRPLSGNTWPWKRSGFSLQ